MTHCLRPPVRAGWPVYPTFGKVAMVCVVGNEDGAHHVIAEI
jgi:hypothetical protein